MEHEPRWELTVIETFDAAHFLPDYDGPCRNMHGHTWRVEISWSFASVDQGAYPGVAMCFTELKRQVRAILPDHQLLNDALSFTPTAENIARWLCEELGAVRVAVWESDTSYATYIP